MNRNNIADTVKNFTKYSIIFTDLKEIDYHLEKAMYLSRKGDGGPVWFDIPVVTEWAVNDYYLEMICILLEYRV